MHEGIRVKPKSRERLQAQVEIFADKGVENFSDEQEQLLKYSAELSTITDLNNLPPELSPEAVALVHEHKEAYIQFRRNEEKQEADFIEANIKRYNETFKIPIAQLKARIAQGDFKQLPEYLGSGSRGSAFRIEVGGKVYAAKFSQGASQANPEIKAMVRASGIAHTSHLISYSFEDNVAIMELLPGTNVTDIPPEADPQYSDEHIIQLIETVLAMDAKGLKIDPKPSNFMYDEKEGFSILDYHIKKGEGQSVSQQIMTLRLALSARKFEEIDYDAPDFRQKLNEKTIAIYKILLPMTIRLITIMKEKYPELLDDWRRRYEEIKANPKMSGGELIRRQSVPQIPEFEPYLKKLDELGF